MNIIRQDIDVCNAIISIEVKKEDYSAEVEKLLKEYRRKANIPGFRTGMAPIGMIKKMVGKSIIADEVNKLLSKSLYEYIDENKINILGDAMPNETEQEPIDFDEDKPMEFKFDIGIAPEINIELSKTEKINFYKISVTREMEENHIKTHLARIGTYVPVDRAEEGDLIKGDLTEIKTGEGLKVLDALITPKYMRDEEIKKLFADKKAGEKIVFNPVKAFENEYEISSLFNIAKNKVQDYNTDFEFVIKEITRHQDAELNQSTFDRILGVGMVNNEADFRKQIKVGLEKTYALDSDYKFMLDAKEFLLKKIENLQFPEEFLKRWLKATNEKATDEVLEKDFPAMLQYLKWDLILASIAKANDVKIEENDLTEAAKEATIIQFAQYGMNNVPDDILNSYIEESIKKDEHREEFYKKALQNKVLKIVKDAVTLTNKKVSLEEFDNLLKNQK